MKLTYSSTIFRSFLFLLLLTALSSSNSRVKRGFGDEGDQKVKTISDTLKSLTIGQDPLLGSSTSTNSKNVLQASPQEKPQQPTKKLTKEERKAAKAQELQDKMMKKRALISGPWNRFEGKHLFQNGVDKGSVDSFAKFVESESFTKKYLIEANIKIYHGGILPDDRTSDGKYIDEWFEDFKVGKEKTPLTIIDSGIDTLKTDEGIKRQYDAWAKTYTDAGKKVPEHSPNWMTKEKYQVTHITYRMEGDTVVINAVQTMTRVELGTDEAGKPSHFNRVEVDVDNLPGEMKKEATIAKFTKQELRANAVATQQFCDSLGVPRSLNNVILDETNNQFVSQKEKFQQTFEAVIESRISEGSSSSGENEGHVSGICRGKARRKRSVGGDRGCAVFVDKNGEVESVHPQEFLEEYKKAGEAEKKHLTDMVKNHPDKISGASLEEVEQLKKVVQLEELKTHVGVVNSVSDVQNVKNAERLETERVVGTVEEKFSKTKAKVSNSKLSWSLASSKTASRIAHGIGTGGEAMGYFFLGKTVINGIVHGDTTSLAIVGARVGYDVVTESTVWVGTKFFATASKVGKSTRVLGKVAGPIGAAADIGLSIYSLTKSVQRLKSATNQYDRNDAIADVVSDSVDIAVTATVTIVSMAFPPAAPFVIAAGVIITFFKEVIISGFKAGNEVAKINSEIPLLGFEKVDEFNSRFLDFFGTRRKDYIDFLLEEKAANDMAVEHNLEFLKNNINFLGVVFPSRTLFYDGGCRLTKQYCTFEMWFFGYFCTHWEDEVTLGAGCEWNRPCPEKPCTDHRENLNNGYNWFSCKCDKKPESTFGFARRDSYVDFTKTQNLFWERAVPKDVEDADFKCKPGSVDNQGYRVSQLGSRDDYLCQNAIGLLRSKSTRKAGQIMLFDLEDGHDQVFLSGSDNTPNMFRVGDEGNKEFHGGGGRNEFLLDGNCTNSLAGSLFGGPGDQDGITFLDTCTKGQEISVDFEKGTLKNSGGNLNLNFENIEIANGRKEEGDDVQLACKTKQVALHGGNIKIPDKIFVPNDSHCSYNLTVMLGAFTNFTSEARTGEMLVLVEETFDKTNSSMFLHPLNDPTKKDLNTTIMFVGTTSSEVEPQDVTFSPQNQSFFITKLSNEEKINFHLNYLSSPSDDWQLPIYFAEEPRELAVPPSVLLLSEHNSPQFFHTLPEVGGSKDILKRTGCKKVTNTFDIFGTNWTAEGGDEPDQFNLHNSQVRSLHGGGGDDTLDLLQDLNDTFTFDLRGSSIETVRGFPGNPAHLTSACDTKMLATFGGSRMDSDVLVIPKDLCSKRDLQILARGFTKVIIEGSVGPPANDSIVIIPVAINSSKETPFEFELQTESNKLSGVYVSVQIDHKKWTVENFNKTQNTISTNIHGKPFEVMKFSVKNDESSKSSHILEPFIELSISDSNEPSAQLVFQKRDGMPTALFALSSKPNSTSSNNTVLRGFTGIPNMFQILNDSWHIEGGRKDDVFFLDTTTKEIFIDGGKSEDGNVLILESSKEAEPLMKPVSYLVNLDKQIMGMLHYETKSQLKSIEHVLARSNKPDVIHAACSTKSVSGRGGHSKGNEDAIFISGKDCFLSEMTIDTGKFSKVVNSAEYGKYIYEAEDLVTSEFTVQPGVANMHEFHFGFNPWDVLDKIGFDKKQQRLAFQLFPEVNETATTHLFKMFMNNGSEDYTNPVFKFKKPGSPISSDLQVSSDGFISATFVVHEGGLKTGEVVKGLPVHLNRFLINATQGSGGVITGSNMSSANQFWIFNLNRHLDTLDAGNCSDCSNYLHLSSTFQDGYPLEIDLNTAHGYVKENDNLVIRNLKNIHELLGRTGDNNNDTVYATCYTRSISEVEDIIITGSSIKNCSYNLVMGIGRQTTVTFDKIRHLHSGRSNETRRFEKKNTFHYRFTTPRTFDVFGSEAAIVGANHNYIFSFTVDDLQSIRFNMNLDILQYTINGSTHFHSMIMGITLEDQFYTQPSMVTRDGFRIQVAREGSIFFVLGAGSSFPPDKLQSEIIPIYESVAKRLKASFILQTDKEFVYVGHGYIPGSRNVLQNVGHSLSHLVGGGTDDTIYEIISLDKDVHIHTGFTKEDLEKPWNGTKQTVEMTDILVPLRKALKMKYMPKVENSGENIVISMAGQEKQYPGKITIYQGARPSIAQRLQFLFYNSMIDLMPNGTVEHNSSQTGSERVRRGLSDNDNVINWKLYPRPISIPEGFVYSLSAEDLEDGHDIRVKFINETESTQLNSTFQAARNDSDLLISNVISMTGENSLGSPALKREITTVIITDFYKVVSEETRMPSRIYEVTLSFPEEHLLLDGTRVLSSGVPTDIPPVSKDEMQKVEVQDWNCMLHAAEEQLFGGMGDVQRSFRAAHCSVPVWPFFVVPLCLVIGVLALVFGWRFARKRLSRSGYQPIHNETESSYNTMFS